MIVYQQILNYSLNSGWLTPFVTGLKAGKAKARKCNCCSKVSFPPLRVCLCGSAEGAWQDLSGTGTIIWRTTGPDGDFALVQCDGADTQTIMRLIEFGANVTHGKIIASDTKKPALCLTPNVRTEML